MTSMNANIKKRLIRTAVLSAVALCIGAGVGFYQIKFEKARVTRQGENRSEAPPPVAGLEIGGPFSLINQDGQAVTEKTYEGQYKLIYFGFTYCPAICPTELQKVSRVINALEKNKPEMAQQVQPLFISVDPQRDTADVMKQYVSLFHPKLIGLTGTQPQIDFVTKSYRIFAKKVSDPDAQEYTQDYTHDYTGDHSSYLYLMGPENTLVSIYRMDDTADEVYKDIVARLEANAS